MKKASYAMKLDTKPRIIEIELNKEILNKKKDCSNQNHQGQSPYK
jgi:hypothetical protein